MSSGQVRPVCPFVTVPAEGERIWFLNNEMRVVAPASATGGAFSLIESVVPAGSGPPLHIHDVDDESFYVLRRHVHHLAAQRLALRRGARAGSRTLAPGG